jgi:DNA-directed RNA polymerase specialized sigma24 family protein
MKRTLALRIAYAHESGDNRPQTVVARDCVRTSRRSWQSANQARRKLGRRKAVAMLALKLSRLSGREIADLFGTTRGNVYVRLHRFRRGRYALSRIAPIG